MEPKWPARVLDVFFEKGLPCWNPADELERIEGPQNDEPLAMFEAGDGRDTYQPSPSFFDIHSSKFGGGVGLPTSWNKGNSLPLCYLLGAQAVWGRYDLTRKKEGPVWVWLRWLHPWKCSSLVHLKITRNRNPENHLNNPPPWLWVPAVNVRGCTVL